MQSKRPAEARTPLPQDVLDFQPPAPLLLDNKLFLECLRTAPRGSEPGPGGCTYEMLRTLLDDEDALEELFDAAQCLARGDVPPPVAEALVAARLTALQKPDGGVRGIATGTTLRRLVARTLARQYVGEVESACAPFQFALSTRAGTDCVAHMVRAITEERPTATLLSIDGIGAFDYVSRAAMLGKLRTLPGARAMLPFLRLSYAQPSHYVWLDREQLQHDVVQGEGGEQGDPLMPMLFALGIHDALQQVASQLLDGESLFAFLDDVYVVAEPARIRPLYDAHCILSQGYSLMKARRGSTTVLVSARTACLVWAPRCGAPAVSRCWAHRLAVMLSLVTMWTRGLRMKPACGMLSKKCPTFSAHGSSWSSAPGPVQTTCCAHSPRYSLRHMLRRMMMACAGRCAG
jgi:hypothetical protein